MKPYKTTIDRKPVSSEEIAKHKDFDSVVKQVKTTTHTAPKKILTSKGVWVTAMVTTVITVTTILYTSQPKNESSAKQGQNKEQTQVAQKQPTNSNSAAKSGYVKPPVKNLNVPYQQHKVQANKGGELKYKTGSTVKIPKNAFVDKQGKAVEGEVMIEYREMHDVVDFIVSGIPMTYDSAGNQYHFESAGMLDIKGSKDGEPVFIAPNKNLEVKMASKDSSTRFNLYQLDTTQRNWNYLGKDKIIQPYAKPKQKPITTTSANTSDVFSTNQGATTQTEIAQENTRFEKEIAVIKQDIKRIESTAPHLPQKADNNRYRFNLDVDPKEFPEVAIYKDAKFEVGPENTNFSRNYYNEQWEDVQLKEGNKPGENYLMTLTKGKEKVNLVVYPVFEAKDYEKAKLEYKQKFEQYEKKLAARKADEKKKEEEHKALVARLEAQYAEQKKQQEEQQKRLLEEQKSREASSGKQEIVVRMFKVSSFGIYNCDNPLTPKGNMISAIFHDAKTNEAVNPGYTWLIQKDLNAIFSFYNNGIKYNPNKQTMLIVVHYGKIGVVSYDEFKRVTADQPKQGEFALRILEKEFSDVQALKKEVGL